jgi:threonyl-tRNA synthetase
MTEREWMNRAIFLETVAGVPGMIGGMQRHLRSLRTLERDHGWIHHLLQEAENERMHLFFFLKQRHPVIMFRILIALAQGIFFNAYFLMYMISPASCHRFVGYLEEEAVHTYTVMLESLDQGRLKHWENMAAPEEAVEYYALGEGAKMRDLILAIRADEACHREVNHHFSDVPSWQIIE